MHAAGAALPEDFEARVYVRKKGSSPGAVDIHYHDALHNRYRSKLEVSPRPRVAEQSMRALCHGSACIEGPQCSRCFGVSRRENECSAAAQRE